MTWGPMTMPLMPSTGALRLLGSLGALLVTGGFAFAAMKPSVAGMTTHALAVTAEPIAAFDKLDGSKTRFGGLIWRGGLVLSAASANFGGWSGLEISADGRDILMVSDAGAWMRARLSYDGARPAGLQSAEIGPIKARDGKNLGRGRDRDAEGLSMVSGSPAAGEALISFESNHRIGRFPISRSGVGAPVAYLELPKGLPRSRRDGLESVAVLSGGPNKGAVLAFTENADPKTGHHAGWMWTKGAVRALSVVSHDGYAMTDAASLPDGSLLLLERRFRVLEGVHMRIRRIAAADIKPGAALDGEVLIEAGMGQQIDNMEGLAVHTGADGAMVLTVVSDDNFNPLLQRTVLLQFTLTAAAAAP